MNEKSYNLKNVRFTFRGGLVADATAVSIARKLQVIDRTAGSSRKEQRTINKEMAPEITVEGWNSDDLAFSDLVPGTPIEDMTIMATEGGTPSVLQDDFFTVWPVDEMCLGDTDTAYNEGDNSKWKTQILCGILNPDALA